MIDGVFAVRPTEKGEQSVVPLVKRVRLLRERRAHSASVPRRLLRSGTLGRHGVRLYILVCLRNSQAMN